MVACTGCGAANPKGLLLFIGDMFGDWQSVSAALCNDVAGLRTHVKGQCHGCIFEMALSGQLLTF